MGINETRYRRLEPREFSVLRRSLAMSTGEMADRLNVREDTVRKWERGKDAIPSGVTMNLRDVAEEQAEFSRDVVEWIDWNTVVE